MGDVRYTWKGCPEKGQLCVAGKKKSVNWKTENKAWEKFMYLLPLVENPEVGGENKRWVLILAQEIWHLEDENIFLIQNPSVMLP